MTAGKRFVVRDHMTAVILVALALGGARTIGWLNAWLYAGIILAIKASSALILVRTNPAVLNARGTKQSISGPDRLFFAVFLPATMLMPVVAGFDVGGPGWTHHSPLELTVGIAMTLLGSGVIIWALAVNPFFEPTVRFQPERNQVVCASGPYRWVRHPGYIGAIMAAAGTPLVLGSYWCFVPVVIVAVAFVSRIVFEERVLRVELENYEAYTTQTRFRLIPFVW